MFAPRQVHACVTCMAMNRPGQVVSLLQVYVVQITSGAAMGSAPSLGKPAYKMHDEISSMT